MGRRFCHPLRTRTLRCIRDTRMISRTRIKMNSSAMHTKIMCAERLPMHDAEEVVVVVEDVVEDVAAGIVIRGSMEIVITVAKRDTAHRLVHIHKRKKAVERMERRANILD